jgi:hypothetical protein
MSIALLNIRDFDGTGAGIGHGGPGVAIVEKLNEVVDVVNVLDPDSDGPQADDITYERADASKKVISASSDDVEAALNDLDDAIGTSESTANGTGVSVAEVPGTRRAVVTFVNTPIPLVDEAGVVAYGSLKVLDLPAGAIMFLGATADLALTKSAAGVDDTWDGDFGLGTTAAGNDNALATTEQDLIPTTATPQAVAGATTATGQSTATEAPVIHDGTTTPVDVYLNLLVDDADHDVTTTPTNLIVTGTVTLVYANLGVY